MFSRQFPKYHPKAGQPTHFVEKIYKSLFLMKVVPNAIKDFDFSVMNDDACKPKHHTIRSGYRWKVGDKFSPRVWSGKPYASKQIILSDDIKIEKIFNIKIEVDGDFGTPFLNGENMGRKTIEAVAMNDGLSVNDFYHWFNKSFEGQILCWSNEVFYP